MTRFIVRSFLIWRLVLFLPLIASELFLPYRAGYQYTNILKFVQFAPPIASPLLYPWANFDGVHYLLIAKEGYTNNLGFLPLFPILIKVFSVPFAGFLPFGVAEFAAGLILANIFLLGSLYTFFRLLRLDYSAKVSTRAIIFLLLFPTAFFFGTIYSESLFLFLALASFYFARQRKWFLAGIFGMLLSATRIVGIFILPALLIEFVMQEKSIRSQRALPLLLIPLGIASFAFYNLYLKGNALYFLAAHGNFANERAVDTIITIPQTIFRYVKILLTVPTAQFEWWIALLEISTFFCVSLLLYIAYKQKVRISYLVFSVLCFFLPALSGTFSGIPRYALILFPIYIVLAQVRNKILSNTYIAVSSVLLFLLLFFFSKGYFIA